jgi:hypothetical protein
VLLVHDAAANRWGALGISRRANLMYKPLEYASLSSILTDFRRSYAVWNHQLVKVRCPPLLADCANMPCRLVFEHTWAYRSAALDGIGLCTWNAVHACRCGCKHVREDSTATGLRSVMCTLWLLNVCFNACFNTPCTSTLH